MKATSSGGLYATLTAEIDLSKFVGNLLKVQTKTRKKIFAVVKADAYGHGAAELACIAERFSDGLCVAGFQEAETICAAGIVKPVLVFSPFSDYADGIPVRSNVVPVVSDIKDFAAFRAIKPGIIRVALKINTGMNRLGISPREVGLALRLIDQAGLKLHSVFSHLYQAGDLDSSVEQLSVFRSATAQIPQNIPRHIAASSSLYLPEEFSLDAVRPGIALYGYSGETEPIQKIYAPILKIFSVAAGEHISYGDYIAPRGMRIAVLGAGYADGIRRKSEPYREDRFVSVAGMLCPIVGQVCMDLTLADVSCADRTLAGGRAYILGEGVTCESIAESVGTNVYEVLTALFSGRIKRNYLNADE